MVLNAALLGPTVRGLVSPHEDDLFASWGLEWPFHALNGQEIGSIEGYCAYYGVVIGGRPGSRYFQSVWMFREGDNANDCDGMCMMRQFRGKLSAVCGEFEGLSDMNSRLFMVDKAEVYGEIVGLWPVWKEYSDTSVPRGYRLTYQGLGYVQWRCPHSLQRALPYAGGKGGLPRQEGLSWKAEGIGKGKGGLPAKERHITLNRSYNEFDFMALSSGITGGHNYRGPRVALMYGEEHDDMMHSPAEGFGIAPLTREMKRDNIRSDIRPHMTG